MNDNFWFNDSAFTGPPTNQSNDEDFFNSFIERPLNQFPQQNSPAPGNGLGNIQGVIGGSNTPGATGSRVASGLGGSGITGGITGVSGGVQGSGDTTGFMLTNPNSNPNPNTVDPLMYVNRSQQQQQQQQQQNLQQGIQGQNLQQQAARSRQLLGQSPAGVPTAGAPTGGPQRRQSQTQQLAQAQAQAQNDPGKREQLLKIRQQIMHQQMLQNLKKQKLSPQSPAVNNPMVQQGIPPHQTDSPEGTFSPAMWQQQQQQQQQQQHLQNQRQQMGTPNMAGVNANLGPSHSQGVDLNSMNLSGGQQHRQRHMGNNINNMGPLGGNMGQMDTPQSQVGGIYQPQLKDGATPAAAAYGSPAAMASSSSNVGTPGSSGQKPGKPSPQQQAQMQMELFMATLQDFMSKRGTPIFQAPMINGKKINLFFLLLMCLKFGGSQRLLKAPTQGPSPWSVIAQKLGIVEGVDPNDVATRSKYEKELIHLYMQILVPYEQYLATPEGDKEFQQRRQHYQQQMLLRSQGQASQNQSISRTGLILAQQMQKQRDSPKVNLPMTSSNHASPAQFVHTPSAMVQPSPALSLAQTPLQRNVSRVSHSSHDLPVVPKPSQPGPQLNQQQAQVVSRPASGGTVRNLATPKVEDPQTRDPTAYRVYAPIRRSLESYGGLDVRALLAVAGEIEITKPVFLFAPELGSVNIHALTMALKTFDGTPSGEVLSALNTLLVTTSDANLAFKLADCPELLDSLLDLGLNVLNHITLGKSVLKCEVAKAPEDATRATGATHIENIFSKYAKEPCDDELREEDIAFVVNSLTGELVEEEDEEDEEDDESEDNQSVFLSSKDGPSPVDENVNLAISDFDKVHINSYMETLLDFRDENKHHFSKIQTKSANDEKVYFVDELITITMILRNILFADTNRLAMASSLKFKKLIFAIVKVAATKPDKFIFARKRLCLLKDCLLLLNKISLSLELQSLEETFLSYLLVTLFGVKIESPDILYYANLDTYSYLLFGIDAFTKLLVREPYNRLFLQAVLTGNLSISSLQGATFTSTPLSISADDQKKTSQLIDGYFKDYPQGSQGAFKNGQLLTTSFQFFLSILPFHSNTLEFSKFLIIRSPTVSQALFGAKILLDLIVNGEGLGLRELACDWLIKFKEPLLQNLVSVCLSLAIDSRDFSRQSHDHKVLSLVILKLLILVNTLLTNAVYCVGLSELSNEKRTKLILIADMAKISPEKEATLDALLNPAVDDDIGKEVLRLVEALRELKADNSDEERRKILEDLGVSQGEEINGPKEITSLTGEKTALEGTEITKQVETQDIDMQENEVNKEDNDVEQEADNEDIELKDANFEEGQSQQNFKQTTEESKELLEKIDDEKLEEKEDVPFGETQEITEMHSEKVPESFEILTTEVVEPVEADDSANAAKVILEETRGATGDEPVDVAEKTQQVAPETEAGEISDDKAKEVSVDNTQV